VGVYYADLSGNLQSVAQVSAKLDQFGWDGGWRINDNAAKTLWLAEDGQGNWLFPGTPSVWVINTITMEIVASEWNSTTVDALAVVQGIDNNY
jgi:hypothetical protein